MDRITYKSIFLSLFIHASVIGLWGGEWSRDFVFFKRNFDNRVTLQFVDSPEDIKEEKQEKESKLISDKMVSAKDMKEDILEKEKMAKAKEILKGKQLRKSEQKQALYARQAISGDNSRLLHPDSVGVRNDREGWRTPPQVDDRREAQDKSAVIIEEKSRASAGVNPQTDNVYTLPEISEDLMSTHLEGNLTFETQYHKLGPYFKEIKKEIENFWLGYLVFKYPNTAPIESETTVSFKILATGAVIDLDVVEYSGDTVFRDFCVATISNTAPYPALPNGVEEVEKEGGLRVVFTFRYR